MDNLFEGMGTDAEIVTNENGGKQSKSPAALHLIDPLFLGGECSDLLLEQTEPCSILEAIKLISWGMYQNKKDGFIAAASVLEPDFSKRLMMASATEVSKGFSYTKFIKEE